MSKRLIICVLAILLCLFSITLSVSCGATDKKDFEVITRNKEFTSTDKEPKYDGFSTIISEDGKQYELTDIEYKRNGTVESGKTVTRTTSRTVNGLTNKSYSAGQTDTISENGKEYKARITNVEYETNTDGNRWGEISGSKDYGLQTEKPSVPDTMALNYYDSGTGQTLTIDAHLTELEQTSSEWQYYSYIDIEVSNYTDSKYMFEGNVIKNNGNAVLPESYYSTLLNLAGMNDGNHRISSVYWLGDAYKNGSVKNRQARADIQAYSASYTAHYYEKFSLDGITTYNATINYEYDAPVDDDKPVYKYTATAMYKPVIKATEENNNPTEPTKEIKTETVVKTITTLSLLLVLCAGFVILIMFLLTKLKLRKRDFISYKNKKQR